MASDAKNPTDEQSTIIQLSGSAFIKACPGAGKTKTMVERARYIFENSPTRRGLAFLSFTNAAIDELSRRLKGSGLIPNPPFPHFIGTFDSFLWQFFIAPFGVIGSSAAPRLIPDKKDWLVGPPFPNARQLPLGFFDRRTGQINQTKADEVEFEPKNGPGAWEGAARSVVNQSVAAGQLDFDDVRICVQKRLADQIFAGNLGTALIARFQEVIVDEAQDCNPSDLEVIDWLKTAGMPVKVICDPHQAIYGFRGGVTSELDQLSAKFTEKQRLPMTGNFRSSPAICSAIAQLRPPASRGAPDQSLGMHKTETEAVHILSYPGAAVPSAIGTSFEAMVRRLGLDPTSTPILGKTWQSAYSAAGRRSVDPGNHKTLMLADALNGFRFSFRGGDRYAALSRLHKVVLFVRGEIDHLGAYTAFMASQPASNNWREEIISMGQALQLGPSESAENWLDRTRLMVGTKMSGSASIAQRLKKSDKLNDLLSIGQGSTTPSLSVHSVKGKEFPAVCVVLTTQNMGPIFDILTGASQRDDHMELARTVYVAASRAQRFLALAVPKRLASDLGHHLRSSGGSVTVSEI